MVITSRELREKLESGEKFIVDMYAEWCGPCRVLGPIVERYAQKLKDEGSEIGVYKFDIESDKDLAIEMGVRSIPTIKAISNGQVVSTKMGVLQESQLNELKESIL
jgi:thioredoxin 1|tara:strand:- start:161 stop:478 length:318 start_codon:yes stop_codon:yes gene_type:complete